MTRYEWVKTHIPEFINAAVIGGVTGCPGDLKFKDMPDYNPHIRAAYGCSNKCDECWQQEILCEEIPTEEPSTPDNVNHPAHYELPGGIECFDVLLATQGLDAVKSFCICNAMKYLFRRNRKNGDEDVKKAAWYIAKYIELSKEADSNG